MSKLKRVLRNFIEEVDKDPRMYGVATNEFVANAKEALGIPKAPLVGWIIPKGRDTSLAVKILGIELTPELRKGLVLTNEEIIACIGTKCNAATAVANVRYMANNKMKRYLA